jgi:excisionase family DNA binding protein
MQPLLVPKKKAAELLGISLRSVCYLMAEGRLKSRKIGGRVLIATEELERFLRHDRMDPIVPQQAA